MTLHTPAAEAALAVARGIALTYGESMKMRLAYEPEVVPGGTDDVQCALVTETGSRFNVTVAFAGNEWEVA